MTPDYGWKQLIKTRWDSLIWIKQRDDRSGRVRDDIVSGDHQLSGGRGSLDRHEVLRLSTTSALPLHDNLAGAGLPDDVAMGQAVGVGDAKWMFTITAIR